MEIKQNNQKSRNSFLTCGLFGCSYILDFHSNKTKFLKIINNDRVFFEWFTTYLTILLVSIFFLFLGIFDALKFVLIFCGYMWCFYD